MKGKCLDFIVANIEEKYGEGGCSPLSYKGSVFRFVCVASMSLSAEEEEGAGGGRTCNTHSGHILPNGQHYLTPQVGATSNIFVADIRYPTPIQPSPISDKNLSD
jgi:hypothetical protein